MSNQLLFPKLFERANIGNLKLKNRIVMLPMRTAYAALSGEVTQRTIDHYGEKAQGGVGLITPTGCSWATMNWWRRSMPKRPR
jgi:2,4-dienoyl-CoA reductase-like NADH-dependent reductase (Old Yellow Enzyme family)